MIGVVAGVVLISGVLFLEKRLTTWETKGLTLSLPADSGAPAGTGETQPAEPQRSNRLDIGDLAHDPGAGNVGTGRGWGRACPAGHVRARLYGGLGFAAGPAPVWIVLFTVLLPLMLALAGDTR